MIGVPLLVDATPAMLAAAETRLSRPAYKRARHVIDEIARVEQAVAALGAGDLAAVGKLLFASHRSSRTWFENSSPELDFLVDSLEPEKGVYGARLTGGGFGGAVMALTSDAFGEKGVGRVAEAYLARFGAQARHPPRPHGGRRGPRHNQGRELGEPGVDPAPQEEEVDRPRDREHRPEGDVHAEADVGGRAVRGLGARRARADRVPAILCQATAAPIQTVPKAAPPKIGEHGAMPAAERADRPDELHVAEAHRLLPEHAPRR